MHLNNGLIVALIHAYLIYRLHKQLAEILRLHGNEVLLLNRVVAQPEMLAVCLLTRLHFGH
jgi:hypothetical protein